MTKDPPLLRGLKYALATLDPVEPVRSPEWEDVDRPENTQLELVETAEVELVGDKPERTPQVEVIGSEWRDQEGNLRLPRADLARFRELHARAELHSLKRQLAAERWEQFLATDPKAQQLKTQLVDSKAAVFVTEREIAEFKETVQVATGIHDLSRCTIDDTTGLIFVLGED